MLYESVALPTELNWLNNLKFNDLQWLFPLTANSCLDILPTLGGMKHEKHSKPGAVTVGNVIVRIYKRARPTASGKCRTVMRQGA